MVIYKSKMTYGKNKRNFLAMDAEEFIAAITQHVPEKSFQISDKKSFFQRLARKGKITIHSSSLKHKICI